MSQVTDFDIPASPLTMSALATALEAVFDALGSINRGAVAPSNPFEGMLWWDSAAAVEMLKRYTVTAGWVSILSVNRTTGAVAFPGDSNVVTLTDIQTLTNKRLTSPKINEDVALSATATQLNRLAATNPTNEDQSAGAGVTLEHTGSTTIATLGVSGPWTAGDWVYVDAEVAGTKGATAGLTYLNIVFTGPTVEVLASNSATSAISSNRHVEASTLETWRLGGMAKITVGSAGSLTVTLSGQSLGSDTTIPSLGAQLGMVRIKQM